MDVYWGDKPNMDELCYFCKKSILKDKTYKNLPDEAYEYLEYFPKL